MKPKSINTQILLTAITPISHHDPAIQDGSNVLMFNRQKQLVKQEKLGTEFDDKVIKDFCTKNPVPADLADIIAEMSFLEFAATALIRQLIDMYNSADGTGLFSGMKRYELLESRARSCAVRSSNIRSFWSNLTKDLQLPAGAEKYDVDLMAYFSFPAALQFAVVKEITQEYRSIITVARVWHNQKKLQNEDYAFSLKLMPDEKPLITLNFNQKQTTNSSGLILEVPSVSSNTLRHQLVRESGWLHLFGALDLMDEKLPAEAEAIFYNGGNIRSGAKQPMNAFHLANQVRKNYPLLDLLGGVCDSFDLGESLLSVVAMLICKENEDAIPESTRNLPSASISAFDLLDDVTHTRQATEQGVGQMIYNFETLVPGTQIVVRLALKPYANQLAIGALGSAIKTYLENHPVIAGQSARGFGMVEAAWLTKGDAFDEAIAAYENYLQEHHDELRQWILDGTLGTSARVVS